MPEPAKFIGVLEAAAILGISRSSVHRWVSDGKLTAVQKLPAQTGAYLFDPAEVERVAAGLASENTAVTA